MAYSTNREFRPTSNIKKPRVSTSIEIFTRLGMIPLNGGIRNTTLGVSSNLMTLYCSASRLC